MPGPEPDPALVFAPMRTRCVAGLIDLAVTLAVVVPLGLVLHQTGVLLGAVLVIAAFVEVYVSPHLFVTLTHIHPPIVRSSEGWIVTVR